MFAEGLELLFILRFGGGGVVLLDSAFFSVGSVWGPGVFGG